MEKRYVAYNTGWGCASFLGGATVAISLGVPAIAILRGGGLPAWLMALVVFAIPMVCLWPSFAIDRLSHRNTPRKPSD